MRFSSRIFTFAALYASLSTAYAFDTPPSADVRCLLVGSGLNITGDAKQRAAGQMLALYFMARLEKFAPKEIEDAMFDESTVITRADFQSEAVRCGKILVEKGQEMAQIGNKLVRRGKEMKDKQTAPPAAGRATAPSDETKTSNSASPNQ
jgi:hypothetical protein